MFAFSGCNQQKELLAECKGIAHAEKIKRLHLSVTADIIRALNRRAHVERCSVFTRKTAIPAHKHHKEHHKKHHGDHKKGNHEAGPSTRDLRHDAEVEARLRAEAKVQSGAATMVSKSSASLVLALAMAIILPLAWRTWSAREAMATGDCLKWLPLKYVFRSHFST